MNQEMTREAVERIAYSPNNACFACGAANPHGLHIHFEEHGGTVRAEFIPEEWQQGWQNVVHGGVISTLLDEAMAYCLFFRGEFGVTARLDVRYRAPARAGDRLRVEARVVRAVRRVMDTEAVVYRGDEILAEATARFLKVGDLTVAEIESSE